MITTFVRCRKKLCRIALLAAVATPVRAHAAEPTSEECLAASERWISLRNAHRLLEARAELLVCASGGCPAEIRDECATRVGEINQSIPSIVFEAKDAAGNELGAVHVTLDGRPFLERLEGASVPVDPGEHVFRFETAGKPPFEKSILIVEGSKDRHESVTFDSPYPAELPGSTAPLPDHPKRDGTTQRILGWTGVGLGVVGVTIGVVFELQRSSKLSDRDDLCPGGTCRVDATMRDRINALTSDARSASTVSTVGFVAGGLLAAGGLALVFTAPRRDSSSTRLAFTPVAAPNFQGLTVQGSLW